MAIRTVEQLRNFCSDCEVLRHVLGNFTSSENSNDILNELRHNDTLWAMSEQNDINEESLYEWIDAHMESHVTCSVFKEKGPAGGWPVVKIECLDKVFYIDWCYEN